MASFNYNSTWFLVLQQVNFIQEVADLIMDQVVAQNKQAACDIIKSPDTLMLSLNQSNNSYGTIHVASRSALIRHLDDQLAQLPAMYQRMDYNLTTGNVSINLMHNLISYFQVIVQDAIFLQVEEDSVLEWFVRGVTNYHNSVMTTLPSFADTLLLERIELVPSPREIVQFNSNYLPAPPALEQEDIEMDDIDYLESYFNIGNRGVAPMDLEDDF